MHSDYSIWTERFGLLFHVMRDDDFIERMVDNSTAFYGKHILFELLTRRLEIQINEDTDNQEILHLSASACASSQRTTGNV